MAGQEYTETSKRNKKYQHTKDSVQEPPTRAAPMESLDEEIKEDKEDFDSRKRIPEGLYKELLLTEKSFGIMKVFPRKKS